MARLLDSGLVLGSALATLLAACGGDGPREVADARYGDSYTIDWGPVTVQPGEEDTRCVIERLSNDAPIKVGRFVNELGPASHHMIVYKLTDGDEVTEPQHCNPFQDVLDPSKGAPLVITQKKDDTLSLPPGVAVSLDAHQLVRIELHFINTGSEAVDLTASSTFVEIPPEDFQNEANFLFVGNPDIDIQPHSKLAIGPSFLPIPGDLAGIDVFAITGHEHRLGTGVTVDLSHGKNGPSQPLYAPDSFSWSDPPTTYLDPAVEIAAGDGFSFGCSWDNTTDTEVKFGESASDEMCFFWAYYYPSQGPKLCVHSDQYGVDACCPGDPLCALIPK